jgi:hypothetical protein
VGGWVANVFKETYTLYIPGKLLLRPLRCENIKSHTKKLNPKLSQSTILGQHVFLRFEQTFYFKQIAADGFMIKIMETSPKLF